MLLTLPPQGGHMAGQETCHTKTKTTVGNARAPLVTMGSQICNFPLHL